jgi:hypothetical protein
MFLRVVVAICAAQDFLVRLYIGSVPLIFTASLHSIWKKEINIYVRCVVIKS